MKSVAGEFSPKKVTQHGTWDGRGWRWILWPFFKRHLQIQPPPPTEANSAPFSQYENAIIDAARHEIDNILQRWYTEDNRLRASCQKAAAQFDEVLEKAEKEIKEAVDAGRNIKTIVSEDGKLLAEDRPLLTGWIKWLIIFLIAVSETYFNRVVFESLQMEPTETWVIAFAMLFALIFIPHFIGANIKREGKSVKDMAIIVLAALVNIGAILGVAFLRLDFFENMNAEIMIGHRGLPPKTVGSVFLMFNFTISFMVALIAYEAAYKYPEKQKKIKQAWEGFSKEAEEASDIAKVVTISQNRLQETCEARRSTIKQYRQKVVATIDTCMLYINLYRDANISANMQAEPHHRRNEPPPSFSIDRREELKIPVEFNDDGSGDNLQPCRECLIKKRSLVERAGEVINKLSGIPDSYTS